MGKAPCTKRPSGLTCSPPPTSRWLRPADSKKRQRRYLLGDHTRQMTAMRRMKLGPTGGVGGGGAGESSDPRMVSLEQRVQGSIHHRNCTRNGAASQPPPQPAASTEMCQHLSALSCRLHDAEAIPHAHAPERWSTAQHAPTRWLRRPRRWKTPKARIKRTEGQCWNTGFIRLAGTCQHG